jgi:hypothetical protein
MNQLPLIGLDPDRPFAVIGGDGHSYRVIDVFDISSGCNKIIGETQRGVVGNGSSIYCNNNCMGLDAAKDRPRPGSRAYGVGPGPNSRPLACPCECNSGGFCGGCGHAGCGGR